MDRCVDVAIAYARAQVDGGADTIGIGDAIASQVSPELYEQHILPREKRLVDAIKSMGAYVRLHICGNITHLLDGISELAVDILDVDHMVDMTTAREKVGSGVALSGNIDPVEGVLRGTPASIRDYVQRMYEQVGNPYLVNAGCEIPPGTPEANLRALCEPVAWAD
jgi:MtaA/CmuA family methyltransferase